MSIISSYLDLKQSNKMYVYIISFNWKVYKYWWHYCTFWENNIQFNENHIQKPKGEKPSKCENIYREAWDDTKALLVTRWIKLRKYFHFWSCQIIQTFVLQGHLWEFFLVCQMSWKIITKKVHNHFYQYRDPTYVEIFKPSHFR